nr:hypothetical protein [Tanacetum cinerariifolium]
MVNSCLKRLKFHLASFDMVVKERTTATAITGVNNQLNTEIIQRDTMSSSESALTFAELFEINDLKAQVDVAPLVPKLCKNRKTHTDYIRHTQEEAATLREIVESKRLLSPLNTSLAYA